MYLIWEAIFYIDFGILFPSYDRRQHGYEAFTSSDWVQTALNMIINVCETTLLNSYYGTKNCYCSKY